MGHSGALVIVPRDGPALAALAAQADIQTRKLPEGLRAARQGLRVARHGRRLPAAASGRG